MSIAVVVAAVAEPQATFTWRVAPNGGIAAPVAASALATIYQRDGAVTATAVVDTARAEASPLHAAFEWNDEVAGEKYRESQAEHLMRSLVVVYRKPDGEPTQPTRYLVKVRGRDGEEVEREEVATALAPHNYVPVQRVMDDADLRHRYVRQAYGELTAWRRRYQGIAELAAVFEAIDTLNEP